MCVQTGTASRVGAHIIARRYSYRLTLWHHVQPCPDDEERYDLILERSIPVIVLQETFAAKDKPALIELCVETTLRA